MNTVEVPDEIQGKIQEITAGDCHTVFLMKNKRVHLSGKDITNELIKCFKPEDRVIKTSSGLNFTVFLFNDGRALAVGSNDDNQC